MLFSLTLLSSPKARATLLDRIFSNLHETFILDWKSRSERKAKVLLFFKKRLNPPKVLAFSIIREVGLFSGTLSEKRSSKCKLLPQYNAHIDRRTMEIVKTGMSGRF